MKKIIVVLILNLTLCAPAFAQNSTNQTDWNTFTITTYYPSPHGVYNRMEVKRALSVGNFTGAPSGLGSVLDLDGGQLFVGESMILKSQDSSNPPDGLAGQLIYVNNTTNNERMLKFYNGTAWVNATTTGVSGDYCGNPLYSCQLDQAKLGPLATYKGTVTTDDIAPGTDIDGNPNNSQWLYTAWPLFVKFTTPFVNVPAVSLYNQSSANFWCGSGCYGYQDLGFTATASANTTGFTLYSYHTASMCEGSGTSYCFTRYLPATISWVATGNKGTN